MKTVIQEIKSSIAYYEDMVVVVFEPDRQKYQERLKEYKKALEILEATVNFDCVSETVCQHIDTYIDGGGAYCEPKIICEDCGKRVG